MCTGKEGVGTKAKHFSKVSKILWKLLRNAFEKCLAIRALCTGQAFPQSFL